MSVVIIPAVLPSSRRDLVSTLARVVSLPTVSHVQIDLVDGRFATPASWPYTAPRELKLMKDSGMMLPHLDRIAYEVDFMCEEAVSAAEPWLALGATRLTFHAESTTDLPRLLTDARERYGTGMGFAPGLISFGLALNVTSDLSLVEQNLPEIEYVQFMGIARIGRQGQPFDERVFENVRVFHSRHPEVKIQVDGGVSLHSAKKLIALGVSGLVVGSALLKAFNLARAFAAFENL